MSVSSQSSTADHSANQPYFNASFVHKAHQVLKLGYDRLDAPSLSSYREEDITGELTREMQAALENPAAPRWCSNFSVHEESRINKDNRHGKDRRRIDIEIIKHQSGKRPRLRFEAKRLSQKHSFGKYLGTGGLECFLDGSYASEDTVVGMLGYVQDRDAAFYSTKIETELNKNPEKYHVDTTLKWRTEKLVKELDTYRSRHHRKNRLPPVDVIHTLLVFC